MRRRLSLGRTAGAGFSLPELVVVIAVAGILAAVAMPRMSLAPYNTLGYHARLQAALQYARKAAVAERRNVCVAVAGSSVTLTRATAAGAAAACTAALVDPSTGQAFALAVPNGVTLTASAPSFSFDALGRASVAATVTVNGDANRVITIEAQTGFVH
jgi:MSHA pilin protein MshC